MRVAVVGLGGVGGYIAGYFAKAGIDVVGFARGEHLDAIEKNGLEIVEDTQSFNVKLQAQTLQEAKGTFDVVLFCVKSYDLAQSYKAIAPHTTQNTILLSFSNGVNSAEVLKQLSQSIVLQGAIYILSHIQKAGVIRKKGKVFAAVFGGENQDAVQKVASLFEQANLRYKTPQNIDEALWKKYIFIATFATLTSYYDKPIFSIYKEHFNEAKQLLEEIALVAKQKGLDIEDEIEKSLKTASNLPEKSSTSMHLDFQNNKKTELETLSGYIVQEAQKHNVEVPLMQKLYKELLKK